MECRICVLSILTICALELTNVHSDPVSRDTGLAEADGLEKYDDLGDTSYAMGEMYDFPLTDDEYEKRRSLMRFGKRRSLMRFGKRGSLMRFGKRPSLMRFGKKNEYNDAGDFLSSELFGENIADSDLDKRGSLMRFGKKSSLMRFGRSADKDKKPHTPWRFGRYLF